MHSQKAGSHTTAACDPTGSTHVQDIPILAITIPCYLHYDDLSIGGLVGRRPPRCHGEAAVFRRQPGSKSLQPVVLKVSLADLKEEGVEAVIMVGVTLRVGSQ